MLILTTVTSATSATSDMRVIDCEEQSMCGVKNQLLLSCQRTTSTLSVCSDSSHHEKYTSCSLLRQWLMHPVLMTKKQILLHRVDTRASRMIFYKSILANESFPGTLVLIYWYMTSLSTLSCFSSLLPSFCFLFRSDWVSLSSLCQFITLQDHPPVLQ